MKATIEDGKLVVEPVPSLEELLENPVTRIGAREAEKLSEGAQKEEGIHG